MTPLPIVLADARPSALLALAPFPSVLADAPPSALLATPPVPLVRTLPRLPPPALLPPRQSLAPPAYCCPLHSAHPLPCHYCHCQWNLLPSPSVHSPPQICGDHAWRGWFDDRSLQSQSHETSHALRPQSAAGLKRGCSSAKSGACIQRYPRCTSGRAQYDEFILWVKRRSRFEVKLAVWVRRIQGVPALSPQARPLLCSHD